MNPLYFDTVPAKLTRFALAAIALFLLFLYGLDRVGMLKEDEPRYVAIGKSMAATGDWITPRLWGEPWFEKPALLYWMVAAGYRAGLPDELAARYPIALASIGFLIFFWITLRSEFGERAAWYSSIVLATSAGWLSLSHVAVTDLPMSAAFSAAMLLGMSQGAITRTRLFSIGCLMGVAVLGKVLVPAVLAVPLMWQVRKRLSELGFVIGVALAVALPWYVLCFWLNGSDFFNELFIRQMFGRMVSEERAHVYGFFFYVPVILGALFPWTAALSTLCDRKLYVDPRMSFLLKWVLWGLLFFSLSVNKLPGYLLPLLPALAALVGIAMSSKERPLFALTGSAVGVALIPVVAAILPDALESGIKTTALPDVPLWIPTVGIILALGAYWATKQLHKDRVVAGLAAAVVAGTVWVKWETFPILDQKASTRALWKAQGPEIGEACEEYIRRGITYGLSFYAGKAIPNCTEVDRPLVLVRDGPDGDGVRLERR